MAKIVKNLYDQNLGFKLDNSTFQRVVATVQEHMSNTIYVAFAIEVGGFGTLLYRADFSCIGLSRIAPVPH